MILFVCFVGIGGRFACEPELRIEETEFTALHLYLSRLSFDRNPFHSVNVRHDQNRGVSR